MRVMSFFKPINIMLFIFMLIQVTNLKVNFPPRNLILFSGCLGFMYFFYKVVRNGKINKDIMKGFISLVGVSFFLIISILFNQYIDFFFLKEIIIYNFFGFFSAIFIVSFFEKNSDNFLFFSKVLIVTVTLQLIMSFIVFFVPVLFEITTKIFETTQDEDFAVSLNQFRMVGIGAAFFQSGLLNIFTLILIAGLLVSNAVESKVKKYLFFMFCIISIIGLFSSRSTVIGILLALSVILLNVNKAKSTILYSVFLVFTLLLIFPFINFEKNGRLDILIKFGLEFLYNFNNSQASQSTGQLKEMLQVWPDSLKTWLIGDVKYRDGEKYYMHTDVGYARFIFSVGVFGTLTLIFGQIYLILKLNKKYFGYQAKLALIIALLISNIKGVSLFTLYLIVLYIASMRDKDSYHKK